MKKTILTLAALAAAVLVVAAISVTPDPVPLPDTASVYSITLSSGATNADGAWIELPAVTVTLVGCNAIPGVTDPWGRQAYEDTGWVTTFSEDNDAVLQNLWANGWSGLVTKAEQRAQTLNDGGRLEWKRQ